MITHEEIPEGYDFDSKFDTYILAFCIDSDSWFATNERFFFYEYPMEFKSESAAIEYFKMNLDKFIELEINMGVNRPSFNKNGVYLENTRELIKIKD